MGTPKDSQQTKARIIEAAGQLFAERGFKAVTVRDIAAAAKTQISALNYHFRSKDELYREVVVAACMADLLTDKQQAALRAIPPDKALRLIIAESQETHRKRGSASWQSTLLARESRDPSQVFTEASEIYFKPQADFMATLIGGVVGKPADDMRVRLAVLATWTLFDTFVEYAHLVEAASPGLLDDLRENERLADWLYDISVYIASKTEDER